MSGSPGKGACPSGVRNADVHAHALTLPGTAAPWAQFAMIVQCGSCSALNRLPVPRMQEKAKCAACKGALLPLVHPVAVGSVQDFDELVRDAPAPVLVDFWAAWCGPCRAVAPELEKLAAGRAGRVIVAKVDTEALPQVAARFGIQSIPTMVLFRDGKESNRLSGAMSASAILARFAL